MNSLKEISNVWEMGTTQNGSSIPNKPNVGTDTLHDFHGCVGEKYSLETLIGG
jgi:hypothetical protein